MAVIFYLSSQPAAPLPPGLTDKSSHVLGYLGLAVLVVRAIAGGLPARVSWRIAITAVALTAGYGMTDEFHQSFVPGRTADLYDGFADAIGAVFGTIACCAWGIIAPSSRPQRGPLS
jgi:VanZ family protein